MTVPSMYLKYKIRKAETGVRSDEQIRILEDYKENVSSQRDGPTSWLNYVTRMAIRRNAWISVMKWFSGSVMVSMS